MSFKPGIVPLGDSSALIRLGGEVDLSINQKVHALAGLIHASSLVGIIETVPAYSSLLVHYDPLLLTFTTVKEYLHARLDQVSDSLPGEARQIDVPVQYGGEYGPDLEFVASHCKLSVADVIRIHSEKTYTVFMMGFTPGYPYLGKLDDRLITPRLEAPRTHVPAGTVAIAGSQTGIYSIESPGGWRLIGRTSLKLFDPASESPFLFFPGDQVRFVIENNDS
jgi:inhibitor of KinA